MELDIREEQREIRSEQLNQKVTPDTRRKLDDLLKKMGFPAERDGHVKWDQDKLLDMIQMIESHIVMDDHENYAEVVNAINQYTTLINTKIISLISDLDTSEARIRSEYEAKIASKDSIIKDLQDQRSAQESDKKTAIEDAAKSKDDKKVAEERLKEAESNLEKSESTVKDKESIIQMLTSKLKESDDKLAGYDSLIKSEESLKKQVTVLLHQKELDETNAKHINEKLSETQSKCTELEKQIDTLTGEKAELHDLVKSLQRDLEEQKNAAEQSKILEVERAVKKTQDEMRSQMEKLRDEKTRLEVQLEIFKQNE